jgi:signal transduction histidine kinase
MSGPLRQDGGVASITGSPPASILDDVHGRLCAGPAAALRGAVVDALHQRALATCSAAGDSPDADRLSAHVFAADVLLELAADGRLEADGTRSAVQAVAEACGASLETTAFDLYTRTVTSPFLLELPPIVAAEIPLRLLVHLGVASEVSLWGRSLTGVEPILAVDSDTNDGRVRAAADHVLGGRRRIGSIGRSELPTAVVTRLGERHAAIVARTGSNAGAAAYLSECAIALRPVLEREALLVRGAARERMLTQAAERRLTRLGFDLHDGPIQEVLALAEDMRKLRDELSPFILESQRELASGRFDDGLARLVELDRQLRELAHALESRSIVSRPLSEVLHREVDTFAARSGIASSLEFDGEAESLSDSQRIVVFRVIQESLTNIREHSGATEVSLRVRAGRGAADVEITDNGNGFEVEQALARAAQRGRLGLVGIGERVNLLGGTLEIDSTPGGPTTLRLALPRWERLEPLSSGDG